MIMNFDPNFANLATQKLAYHIGNLFLQIVTLETRIEMLQKQLEQYQQTQQTENKQTKNEQVK